MRFLTIVFLLAISGCEFGSGNVQLSLDGEELCVPKNYIRSAPSWITEIAGLDTSYAELWVIIPYDEVLATVPDYQPSTYPLDGGRKHMDLSILAANRSAITGRSGAQERLIEVALQKPYTEVAGTGLFRIDHFEEYEYWSLVRWRPEEDLPNSPEELHRWVAGYCSDSRVNDDLNDCSIQRLYGNITYSFSVSDNNLKNLEALEALVETRFKEWKTNCQGGA